MRAAVLLLFVWGCDGAELPEAPVVSPAELSCERDGDCTLYFKSCVPEAVCGHIENNPSFILQDFVCDEDDYARPSGDCVCGDSATCEWLAE